MMPLLTLSNEGTSADTAQLYRNTYKKQLTRLINRL